MIYNLRGTNGSGKSHCVHELLAKHPQLDLLDYTIESDDKWEQTVGLSVPELRLRTIGIYDMQCGGCDWYIAHRGNTDSLENLVERLADAYPEDHLIFEGFMVTGTFGRWNDLAARLAAKRGKECVKFCFLDTPVEVCKERIIARRRAKLKPGQVEKEFNDKNCRELHRQNLNNVENFRKAGRLVEVLDYQKAPELFYDMVRRGI